jgi:creatinine amidohydrolase
MTGAGALPASRRWADLTSEAFAGLDRAQLVAVLPVGAIEQHGPHLPMAVDTATVQGLVDATVLRLPADLPVLFLPVQPVGKSNEHTRYPGTLTLSAPTLIALWTELGQCVAAAGVRKLVLFNGHGGQESVLDIVARDLRVRHGMAVVTVNWYQLGLPAGTVDADEDRLGIHAGELETSILLALAPETVRMDRARHFANAEVDVAGHTPRLSFLGGGARLAWQTQDLNPQGACGNAAAGTAEKGRRVIDHVAARFVEVLHDVHRLRLATLDAAPAW